MDVTVPLSEKVDILFLGSSYYAFDVDYAEDNIGKIVCFATSAMMQSMKKTISKVANDLGILVADAEFHCRGSFGPVHKGRPNEKDLQKINDFAKKNNRIKGDKDMKEVYEFLKKCGVYYLATVEGDQPRVRPFGTIDLFEDKLYIQTGKVKAVAQQMKANPKVEISAMNQEGKWIRISAEAVLDENIKAQEHMLDNYPDLKAMYKAGDGNTEVYYLKNGVAQICSFTEKPHCIEF